MPGRPRRLHRQLLRPRLHLGACYEKAGELCGPAGYDTMGRGGDSSIMFTGGMGGSTQTRNLLIVCRRPALAGPGPA
jgi:hypothetical protein